MKAIKISIVCFAAIIISLLCLIIINSNKVEGWNDFKKEVINNCPYVKSISIDSYIPPDINIVYLVNKELDMKEIDEVFVLTKNYIFREEVFNDLKKLHKKEFKYSFSCIKIRFKYRNSFKCEIYSASDVGGEPVYNSFNKWYISINNGPTREYILEPR